MESRKATLKSFSGVFCYVDQISEGFSCIDMSSSEICLLSLPEIRCFKYDLKGM